LIAEFIILLPALSITGFVFNDLARFIAILIVLATLWLTYRAYRIKNEELGKTKVVFAQFKRDKRIFLSLMKQEGQHSFEGEGYALVIGDPEAPVQITAFLSLYCNPCAKAFSQLENLFKNNPEFCLKLIFSVYDDEECKKIINVLYYLETKKGAIETLDFLREWYSTPAPLRKGFVESITYETDDVADKIQKGNSILFKVHRIKGTPTIYFNGYLYPAQYNYDDAAYYISEIIQLTMESKRQEARPVHN
jgi:thiol-disulfide isomerase/thioredoxin